MENARQENRSIGEEDKSLQAAQPSNNLSGLIQHFKNNTRSNFKPGGMVSLLITAGLDHTTKLRRHLETSGLWIFTHISPLLSHNHWLEPNSRNLSFAKKPFRWNTTPTTPPFNHSGSPHHHQQEQYFSQIEFELSGFAPTVLSKEIVVSSQCVKVFTQADRRSIYLRDQKVPEKIKTSNMSCSLLYTMHIFKSTSWYIHVISCFVSPRVFEFT